MKALRNIIVILILLGAVGGFFGPKVWKTQYAQPRKAYAAQKSELEQRIANGQNQVDQMRRVTTEQMGLYTRSFPLRPNDARLNYQIWLKQLAEFCEMKNPMIDVGYGYNGAGTMTHVFRLHADCSCEQLYRFLYEFYWTGYLHRIRSLNIQTSETTDLLGVSLLIEGLTMAKINPYQPYPSMNQLPAGNLYFRRLASAPWQAYKTYGLRPLFQFTRPGIDEADFAILAALPTTENADGQKVTQIRWNLETTGKTLTVLVGEELSIGSFHGVVEEVIDDMAVLKGSNGYKWVLGLGDRLSDAACIPSDLN